MTVSNGITTTELEQAIERYANSLKEIESEIPNLSEAQVLQLLLGRDAVEDLLTDKTQLSEEQIINLIELDERLKKQGKAIASSVKLAKFQKVLKPDESAWWWFFQSPKQIDRWDRFDWLWNVLTAAALGLGGSYMFITLQAFAVGGLGVAEAFGTIAQATGIALLGKGALTSGGNKQVEQLLEKVGIPSKFHSEVTCAGSIALMLAIYGIHTHLPNILYKQGVKEYNAGNLRQAEEKLLQAIQLNPQKSQFYIPLGEIYETTTELNKALQQYKNAVADGKSQGFNNAGRVYIQQSDLDLAETLLQAGLQRVENDPATEYQLRRNLGWALLDQKKYAQADTELKAAIALDSTITEDQIGGGMAFCFLAQSLTEQGQMPEAEANWLKCLDKARPETFHEYQWFIQIGQRHLASCINTSGITTGLNDKITKENLAESCHKDKVIQEIKNVAVVPILPENSAKTEPKTIAAITDSEQIKALAVNLQNSLNEAWKAGLPESNAVYQLTVNQEGSILSYKAVDNVAQQFQENTGLDDLLQANADGPVTNFKVVFTPDAEVQVSPSE